MTSAVRPREASDLDACVQILADVHSRDGYPVNWPSDPSSWLTPDHLIGAWVAELDGKVVGQALLTRETDDGTCEVNRLFVSPAARGHRLGERLMTRLTEAAHELGLRPVLEVVTSDTAATALYERLGWVRTATEHADWSPDPAVMTHRYEGPTA